MRTASTLRLSPTISLLLANLITLIGVWVFAWDPLLVLGLYWIEFYLVIVLNTPKIILASADRFGRLPDDIRLWSDGPTVRIGNAWLGVVSFAVYSLFYLVITRMSPLWEVLVDISVLETDFLTAGLLLFAAGSMTVSYLLSFRDEFVGTGEYENVTPGVQLMRPVGKLWIFLLILFVASGLAFFEENLIALVTALIVVKTSGDLLGRRVIRIQPPAIDRHTREQPPDTSPKWAGKPNVQALLVLYGLLLAIGSTVAVSLVGGLYGIVFLDLLGWPFYGSVMVGGVLVGSVLGLFGCGIAVVYLRYRNLEYRVYSTGIGIYNTRHGTLVRFVPSWNIENSTVYRGVFGRLFGTGAVRIELSNAPHDGRFRTIFSSDAQPSKSDESKELMLHAVTDPRPVAELLKQDY